MTGPGAILKSQLANLLHYITTLMYPLTNRMHSLTTLSLLIYWQKLASRLVRADSGSQLANLLTHTTRTDFWESNLQTNTKRVTQAHTYIYTYLKVSSIIYWQQHNEYDAEFCFLFPRIVQLFCFLCERQRIMMHCHTLYTNDSLYCILIQCMTMYHHSYIVWVRQRMTCVCVRQRMIFVWERQRMTCVCVRQRLAHCMKETANNMCVCHIAENMCV